MASWERWGGGIVRSWQGGKGARVVTWLGGKSGRMVKCQGGRFLVLFKSGGHRVSSRFHLFVSDVDQQWNKGAGQAQDIWLGQRNGRTLLRSDTSC